MNEARALGQASNTADDKWLLKSVLRGLRLLPRDEERERRTVAPVDLSHVDTRPLMLEDSSVPELIRQLNKLKTVKHVYGISHTYI